MARPRECAILLFDGYCVLCNGWAAFVVRRRGDWPVYFATLQSEAGQAALARAGIEKPPGLDSVLLIRGERVFSHSRAILEILRSLRWPWPLFYVFILVPRPLRDGLYRWFGNRRYRWFGRRDACGIASAHVRARMLSKDSDAV
ncbi:DCC1-like thiol-disulfide oxidoreductase family protein [Gammaproteobacteria bacterium AB-CW1]|uniref:DCC1-like thiol-disulfide oxidoreductase family protein n=1 Tax=Natronospira elongata TaxID=3110268 RepID=A0AAP6MK15_9GAMM|nr:DCC1-like thiol-disulfide oxidoreductase family protein [Gammaproteobacteria bacterium AB-CW1]